MENLLIHPTTFTPLVSFNTTHNVFTIAGCSYNDKTSEFYKPIQSWLASYLKSNTKPVICQLQLDFFNKTSRKAFAQIFQLFEVFSQKNDIQVSVNWFVNTNDKEMIKEGEAFKRNFPGLHFQFFLEAPESH